MDSLQTSLDLFHPSKDLLLRGAFVLIRAAQVFASLGRTNPGYGFQGQVDVNLLTGIDIDRLFLVPAMKLISAHASLAFCLLASPSLAGRTRWNQKHHNENTEIPRSQNLYLSC